MAYLVDTYSNSRRRKLSLYAEKLFM